MMALVLWRWFACAPGPRDTLARGPAYRPLASAASHACSAFAATRGGAALAGRRQRGG
jgi:hypothetical protein